MVKNPPVFSVHSYRYCRYEGTTYPYYSRNKKDEERERKKVLGKYSVGTVSGRTRRERTSLRPSSSQFNEISKTLSW